MVRVHKPWLLLVTFVIAFLSVTSVIAGRTMGFKKPDEASRLDDEKVALLIRHGLLPFTGWRWWGFPLYWWRGFPGLGGFPGGFGGFPWPWGRRGFPGGFRGFPGGFRGFPFGGFPFGGFPDGLGGFRGGLGGFNGFRGGRGGLSGFASYVGKAEVKSEDESNRNWSP